LVILNLRQTILERTDPRKISLDFYNQTALSLKNHRFIHSMVTCKMFALSFTKNLSNQALELNIFVADLAKNISS